MFYHLLYPLHEIWSPFNVFRYITFRSAGAILTSMVIMFIFAPYVVRRLRKMQVGQFVREELPEHSFKTGTPTMGGVLIVIAFSVSSLLWSDLTNPYVWVVLITALLFAGIGFYDDFLKNVKRQSLGLTIKRKFALQFAVALAMGAALVLLAEFGTYNMRLQVPFFKTVTPELGLFYVAFAMIVLIGSANAVNLTDGLDGLAVGSTLIASATYAIMAYIAGHAIVASYLNVANIKGSGELSVICSAVVGACIGFLWYNSYPAEVFMGDTGSLALGSAIGAVAIMIKQEILLVLVGGLFVMEAISVILQVASFRLYDRRIFKKAPIHHHFQILGWHESKIVIRFWILALIFALASLGTLKLR